MPKDLWKEYFTFSKKERNGIIILVIVPVVFIILPFFIHPKTEYPVIDKEAQQQLQNLQRYADSAKAGNNYEGESDQYTHASNAEDNSTVKGELFYFDPNSLQVDGWKRLGLRDKTIQTILHYRDKGGQFRRPEDIRKIYGLREQEADRLIPYIRIASSAREKEYPVYSTYKKEAPSFAKKQNYKTIDINNSTAEDWKAFPGIGDVLSKRIIKFRTSIGGFTSVEQVKKTYGLPDSVYQFILPYLRNTDAPDGKK